MLGETKDNTNKILIDTGDLLIKADENKKHHEVTWERLNEVIAMMNKPQKPDWIRGLNKPKATNLVWLGCLLSTLA